MTTLATRMRELADLEGFDVEMLDEMDKPIDPKTNGLQKYNFDRQMKSTATVQDWKTSRFSQSYPGRRCVVLYGDGREANGNATLATVRGTYEEP